jgi:Leucine-rich repeat (LRR) protein
MLYCHNNRLTSFEHLNCPLLTVLDCSDNNLTSFEHLNCPLLTWLVCGGNEWEFIPPHINRLLNALKNTQNVYTDRQNVHNHYIQESIRNSIQAVISKKPSIAAANIYETVLSDTVLTKETKEILVEYCKDPNVHSTLHITFEELLLHVFSRIEINEHKQEIKSVLNMEMTDSVCKCFTGRMSRLINCLNGFDDLVSIRISDTEQIGQVIGQIKEQLEAANEYTVEKHREMATKELRAREYSQEVIMEWIGFIE